jgi:hypothetical protein
MAMNQRHLDLKAIRIQMVTLNMVITLNLPNTYVLPMPTLEPILLVMPLRKAI